MPYDSEIIVIGCGNILFKDDGFGPVVINILQKYSNDKNDIHKDQRCPACGNIL